MKTKIKKINISSLIVVTLSILYITMTSGVANGAEGLRYSCSAQIYQAFENSRLDEFTKETGITIDLFVASSESCVYRVMQDMTDVASTTRALYQRHKDNGLVEVPFCKDPLAIITHKASTVDNLTSQQLQQIFSGVITNWKKVGGPDLSITIVVPGEETGANKNFRRQVMKEREIKYDYSTYTSTRVLEAIEELPVGAISFISRGAQITRPNVKTLTIDGKKISDELYPYYQIFYMTTKGEPKGSIKQFINFVKSDKGKAIIIERGMLPVE